MSDSDVSELLSFFDNIFVKNIAYCSVCLRVEEERRLVSPRAVKRLFDMLNLPKDYRGRNLPVCYMCEAYASSVMRFHTLVMTSVSVHDVCQNMRQRIKFECQVRDSLKNQGPRILRVSAKNKVDNQVLDSEMQLKKMRSRFHLQQTEVLIIDSDGVNCSSTMEAIRNDPLVFTLENTVPSACMETVVILDDEDEPKVIKTENNLTDNVMDQNSAVTPKLVPIEKLLETTVSNQNIAALLPNQMQVIQPDKDAASNFMLHPIVIDNDGSFNVPSLSAKLVNGRLVYQEITNPLLLANASNPTILVGSQDKSTILIGNQIHSSILVGSENPTRLVGNSAVSTILEGNDVIPSIVIKEGSVTCLSDVENALDKILKDKADEMTSNYKRSFDGSNGRNKKRATDAVITEKERESKIDWEDKIPMDVISFVDAVDPNADPILRSELSTPLMASSGVDSSETLITSDLPPRLPPHPPLKEGETPLGIITEVRSVPTSISTQTHFEVGDIIDLC